MRPPRQLLARVEQWKMRLARARMGIAPVAMGRERNRMLARIVYERTPVARRRAAPPPRRLSEGEQTICMRLEMAAIRARTPAGAAAARVRAMEHAVRAREDREWTAEARQVFESMGCKSKSRTRH